MTHPPPSLPKQQQQLGRIDNYNPIFTLHKAPHDTTHTYTCIDVVVGSSAGLQQHCQQPDITQQCVCELWCEGLCVVELNISPGVFDIQLLVATQ